MQWSSDEPWTFIIISYIRYTTYTVCTYVNSDGHLRIKYSINCAYTNTCLCVLRACRINGAQFILIGTHRTHFITHSSPHKVMSSKCRMRCFLTSSSSSCFRHIARCIHTHTCDSDERDTAIFIIKSCPFNVQCNENFRIKSNIQRMQHFRPLQIAIKSEY